MNTEFNAPRVAFILNYFPVLSETFIFSELSGLHARNIDLDIYSLFKKNNNSSIEDAGELGERTVYLSDYAHLLYVLWAHIVFLISHPVKYFNTLAFSIIHGKPEKLITTMIKYFFFYKGDRKKVPYEIRQDILLHFVLAVPFARVIMKKQYTLVHSHFADAATSFAMLISRLTGVPFSFTTHATDLFVNPVLLPLKVKNAKFVLTCTEYNRNYIVENIKDIDDSKIILNYHGVDTDKFVPEIKSGNKLPVLLSVGRLVEKKGFDVLLRACSILKDDNINFECRIAGNGPLYKELMDQNKELGLNIKFLGAVSHREMKKHYHDADIFALPCRVARNGDRDGIPNVIAEAMAMELPVVSTTVSGIPEVIVHEKSGFLTEPDDPIELARVLKYLIENPEIRHDTGKRSREHIKMIFNKSDKIDELVRIFLEQLGGPEN